MVFAAAAPDMAVAAQKYASGPIEMAITPCLIASKRPGAQPCDMPGLPPDASPDDIVAARIARANHLIDLQNLKGALAEVDAALAVDPSALGALHLSARLALSLRDLARAERDLAVALQQAPDDPDIRATHAAWLEFMPSPVLALHEYDAIIATHPEHVHARLARAKIHVSWDEGAAALKHLDVVLALQPDNFDAWILRANAHMLEHQPRAAAAAYSTALQQRPTDLSAVAGRAAALALMGDSEAALRDYDQILGSPGSPSRYAIAGDDFGRYLMQRALLLAKMKRFGDAATDMANAVHAGGPQSVLRAQIYLRQNGFPDIPLDGRTTDALSSALEACFRLDACTQGLVRRI
jgi:Tfp pilus assembly protein PilF